MQEDTIALYFVIPVGKNCASMNGSLDRVPIEYPKHSASHISSMFLFLPLENEKYQATAVEVDSTPSCSTPPSCSLFRGGCTADIGEATAFLRQILLAWYGQKVMLPAVQLVGKNRSRQHNIDQQKNCKS